MQRSRGRMLLDVAERLSGGWRRRPSLEEGVKILAYVFVRGEVDVTARWPIQREVRGTSQSASESAVREERPDLLRANPTDTLFEGTPAS